MNKELETLQKELDSLPRGYISNKKINGAVKHYLQWLDENKKLRSKYIPESEYPMLKEKMDRKKEIQKQLKSLGIKKLITPKAIDNEYQTTILYSDSLRRFSSVSSRFKKRCCYTSLTSFLYSEDTPRVCILYGLRRTGKTTLLQQAIYDMSDDILEKSAYIKIQNDQNMNMLDHNIKLLYEKGYKYLFIDEITLLDDFVDTASFLSDVYAALGMKIVLSGTDSLGFYFTNQEELYDRAYIIHTTWIPFAEHSRLLGTDDIDEYIRYGGSLKVGKTDFEDSDLLSGEVSFRDDESTRRYIDTAIVKNIQHSLRCYQSGTHFRHLRELYDNNELTSAINRVVEDMTHRFLVKVLEDDFKSNDISLTKKNLLREKNLDLRSDILSHIDIREVTKRLMTILEIKNQEERKVSINEIHAKEIFEYLKALELVSTYDIRYADTESNREEGIIITQPGMRYAQAEALIYSLEKDPSFNDISEIEKEYVCKRILDEIKGRMLEEIVLFETANKLKGKCDVFKYVFASGEFDMVIYDRKENTCKIYEIKHSKEIIKDQCRHLLDEDKCKRTERIYGCITSKCVLYRGEDTDSEYGIRYLNVSKFLKELKR